MWVYFYVGFEYIGVVGFYKDFLMSYFFDNVQFVNVLQNVMVIFIIDLQGNIIYVNDLFCMFIGFVCEELIGQLYSIVCYLDVFKVVYKDMWDIIKVGKIWIGIVFNFGKGGVFYVVDIIVQLLFDIDGNIILYISICCVVNDLMQNYDLVEFSKEKFDDFYEVV